MFYIFGQLFFFFFFIALICLCVFVHTCSGHFIRYKGRNGAKPQCEWPYIWREGGMMLLYDWLIKRLNGCTGVPNTVDKSR